MTQGSGYRYERVNVRPGFVTIEQGRFGRKHRAYFSEGPTPDREEYREGSEEWKHVCDAQSIRYDLKDTRTGEIVRLDELLGLLYYASARPGSALHGLGSLAHDQNIHVYVAIPAERGDGRRENLPLEKISALNFAFNERLRTREKMILILPDHFGVYKDLTYGEIMIDFGMTSMEAS
jgi:hypothetical protein